MDRLGRERRERPTNTFRPSANRARNWSVGLAIQDVFKYGIEGQKSVSVAVTDPMGEFQSGGRRIYCAHGSCIAPGAVYFLFVGYASSGSCGDADICLLRSQPHPSGYYFVV